MKQPPRITLTELRLDLPNILARIETGDTFHITSHGYPIAAIGPINASTNPAPDGDGRG